MKVHEAMHSGVTWVEPDTPLGEIARMMRDQDIGSVPIGENDRLVGMVTDRDIVCKGVADGRDVASLSAREVMTGPIVFCRAEDDMDDAVRIMEEHEVRRLPVINADKRMVGILSMGDVADLARRDLTAEMTRAVADHHP